MRRHMDERAIRLGERVKAFIRDEDADEFESLALAVFAYQHERNAAYRRFCSMRASSPDTVVRWEAIPQLPAEAFKRASIACGEAALLFHTSGTREGSERRGVHHVMDPEIYELSLAAAFRRFVLPDVEKIRVLSLVPSLAEQPDSSLSYMANEILERYGAEGSATFVADHRVMLGALFLGLDRATIERTPVLVFGTTLVLSMVMDVAKEAGLDWALAPGSRLVDTGGSKGSGRKLEERALLGRYGEVFGLPDVACVNEYGMTEMLSQLYTPDLARALRGAHATAPDTMRATGRAPGTSTPDRRVKVAPHWVRSRIVDPDTLEDADEGLLAHLDLANCHSVAAILTEDLGRRAEEGLELIGRHLGAESRGCSIGMDEWLT